MLPNGAERFLGCDLNLELELACGPWTPAELVLPIGEAFDVVPYVQELIGDGGSDVSNAVHANVQVEVRYREPPRPAR